MTPETEAGRALLANVRAFWNHPWSREEQIAAIEAEARSLAIDRAVEAVREEFMEPIDDEGWYCAECVAAFTTRDAFGDVLEHFKDCAIAAVIEKLESLR